MRLPIHASVRRLDGIDRILLVSRHGAGERLGGRDAGGRGAGDGGAGDDAQEYLAGESHN